LNSLKREKGDAKEFKRLVLCSFGKVRRETQKEFRRLVLVEFFLAKGEENEKIITLLFSMKEQGLETRKLRKLFGQRKKKKKFKKMFKKIVRVIEMQVKVLLL